MGILKNIVNKLKNKKEERIDYERQQRMIEGFEQRKLSNDERLLNQYLEEERQKKIKQRLKQFQKREDKDYWSGKKKNPIYAPNMFKNEKNIFSGNQGNMMKNDKTKPVSLFFKK